MFEEKATELANNAKKKVQLHVMLRADTRRGNNNDAVSLTEAPVSGGEYEGSRQNSIIQKLE